MKRELSYREEMVQQLQIVRGWYRSVSVCRSMLFGLLERERIGRNNNQPKKTRERKSDPGMSMLVTSVFSQQKSTFAVLLDQQISKDISETTLFLLAKVLCS